MAAWWVEPIRAGHLGGKVGSRGCRARCLGQHTGREPCRDALPDLLLAPFRHLQLSGHAQGPACEPQGPALRAPPSVQAQARWCGHAVAFTCRCPCAWETGLRRTGRGLPCYLHPQPPPRGEDALFRQLPGFLASRERGSVLPRQWGPSYSSSSLLLSCQPGGARVGRGGGGGSWPGRKAGCREGRRCVSPHITISWG